MKMKLCPLLEAKGVFRNDPGYGVNKNWVKDICRLECPLEGYCIYDRSGRISKVDRELLLGGKDG